MSHNPKDILDTILEKLRMVATTENVVGQPVTIDNLTILPVIKLTVGFAAGGAEGKGEKDKSQAGTGVAGGGGGGASVSPVGFIAWDGDKVKFISVGKGKIETLVETVPEVMKKFGIDLSKMKGKSGDKDKHGGKKKRSDDKESDRQTEEPGEETDREDG